MQRPLRHRLLPVLPLFCLFACGDRSATAAGDETSEQSAEGSSQASHLPGPSPSLPSSSVPTETDPSSAGSLTENETRQQIRDLIVALTPPASTTTAGQKNNWFERHRSVMERLRKADPDFGRAVLKEYETRVNGIDEVRTGLLDIAAHTLPTETEPILVELIKTFNEPMALRTAACGFLAQISPKAALKLFGPILKEGKHRVTYPPEERMIQAWILAADAEGVAKGAFLGDIAVELEREHSSRQAAVRALATCKEPAAIEALESIMTESSGNHLLRRTATQSLREVLPSAEFCAFAHKVFELESDQGFQLFLADVIEDNCG